MRIKKRVKMRIIGKLQKNCWKELLIGKFKSIMYSSLVSGSAYVADGRNSMTCNGPAVELVTRLVIQKVRV